ncbi:succinate dehydrogenase cytochrome b subunit [Cytophagales bacterium LB-30]|uniref:Succinate dehydrogenase cytochrome b subunit n=1 Tax=Shiella aurantiaca TaxID=3058365 RepID=A0ABT8F4P9_9BACT|nr:succinate dehydrogenase cytochrome b subunit [Shiella aurantiaca]MDN4165422.1 succinate dehydrogenase cytochrome b subunit [Shiella aurantiaca]
MSWITDTLTSTIGRKVLMALTGLFLILFLAVHLAGNLQLLMNDGGEAFNKYAYNMGHNPLIRVVSIGNFVFILLHIVVSILLTRRNKAARPVGYKESAGASNSTWASRNMGVLGTIILIFLVVHLKGFWFEFKFGAVPTVDYDGVSFKNVYLIVQEAYKELWYALFYVVSMGFLAFHLSHGFASAFQTLGLNHKKYSPIISGLGKGFAILVPLLFALIPVIIYIKSLG